MQALPTERLHFFLDGLQRADENFDI